MSEIVFTTTLNTPIEILWHAWIDTSTITKWFSPQANIQPHQGGAYELFWDPTNHNSMSTKGCKIIEIKPPNYLTFQWKGPDQFAHIMNDPPQTTVKVILKPENQTTIQTITHTGWKQDSEWIQAKEWHHKAWQGVINELKKHLSQ